MKKIRRALPTVFCRALPAALLAAIVAPHAHAQSQSLNLSGYLDLGLWRDFNHAKQVSTIQRSYMALAGTEDLGNGNKVIFRLSTRFDLNTGSLEGPGKPFFHDEATVGVQGPWGRFRMGRGLTALWSQDWRFDAWDNYNRIASPAWQTWHALIPTDRTSNQGDPEYGRLNNGVFYDSPNFDGFSFYLSASPQRTDAKGQGRARAASILYEKNGWGGMAAYDRNGSADTGHFFAAKIPAGPVSIMLVRDVSRAQEGNKAKAHTVSGTWAVGAMAFKLGWGNLDLNRSKTNFYGAGAEVKLSKRTMIYASLGHFRPGSGNPTRASTSAYGLGMAHAF